MTARADAAGAERVEALADAAWWKSMLPPGWVLEGFNGARTSKGRQWGRNPCHARR